jgi:hypothetical protein
VAPLATEFGLPADEPGFASNAERVRNRDAVVSAIDAPSPSPAAERCHAGRVGCAGG